MQRHAYGFGTFLEYEVMTGSGPDADKLRAWTLKMFNRCTTPIYWADWGWANPTIRQRYLACAKWAADNKLATRGHCIIYPGWEFLPQLRQAAGQGSARPAEALLEQVVEVTEATRQFKFSEYDVTNELRDPEGNHRHAGQGCGGGVVPDRPPARSAGTRLAINENTILTRGSVTAAEQDNYAQWIKYLDRPGPGARRDRHAGALRHAPSPRRRPWCASSIGSPSSASRSRSPSSTCPPRDEEGQARYTRDFLTAVFSHPATEAFTMWGFWEGRMWQPPAALIRKDWTLKPNGQAWMDLVLKQWWTDMTAATGPDGSCTTRGFLGDYKVTVTAGGRAARPSFT